MLHSLKLFDCFLHPQHFSGNVIYGIAFVVSCAFASVFLAVASFVCVRFADIASR